MSDVCPCSNETQHLPGFTVKGSGLGLSVLSTLACSCLAVLLLVIAIQVVIFGRWTGWHLAQLELAEAACPKPDDVTEWAAKRSTGPFALQMSLFVKNASEFHHSLSRECQQSAGGIKRCSSWRLASRTSIDSASSGSCSPGLPFPQPKIRVFQLLSSSPIDTGAFYVHAVTL